MTKPKETWREKFDEIALKNWHSAAGEFISPHKLMSETKELLDTIVDRVEANTLARVRNCLIPRLKNTWECDCLSEAERALAELSDIKE